MPREDFKKEARQRIWDNLRGASPRIRTLGGLHESDLKWLVERALSTNKSITLKVERETDNNHIRITLEELEKNEDR
tara:strand:+ start:654 stop:884 length:231 start_codon:yes stop_codon:yes gene_type:complete